jgi:hypothetical protein
MAVKVYVGEIEAVGVSVVPTSGTNIDIGPTTVLLPPTYTGATAVTPSGETQTLETTGKYLVSNITVKPIPSNYGLITWNGAVLTVS